MIWTTAEGKVLNVRDMEQSHLENAIKFLERKVVEQTTLVLGAMSQSKKIFDRGYTLIQNYNRDFCIKRKGLLAEKHRREVEAGRNEDGLSF